MGSSFFKDAIDPIGAVAGKNSWLAKEASYDPVNRVVGKYVAPNGNAAGQAYANRNNTGPQATPQYAGIAPTLAAAASGYAPANNGTPSVSTPTMASQAYVQQAQRAAQMQQQKMPQQQGSGSWGSGSYGGVNF
jgi:hypothetical protein